MVNLSLKMHKNHLDLLEMLIEKWPSDFDGHLHYTVGLSGGVDSVVLAYLMAKARQIKPIQLSAIHVNHGISENADIWENFCEKFCTDLKIPLTVVRLKIVKAPGEGLENTARIERYKEYQKLKDSIIVLAHHQDDQIETMLIQLARGSDIHNIAAMNEVMTKSNQTYWRPLLNLGKNEIIDFASINNLQHIEDESNTNNTYLRNFIRNQIIPELVQFDPFIKKKFLNSLVSIQKNTALTDEYLNDDLNFCLSENNALLIEKFAKLTLLRQQALLAYFIRSQNLPLPSQKQLQEFRYQILNAAPDRHPSLLLDSRKKIIRTKNQIIIVDI